MEIIEGKLPTESEWRVLILLQPGEKPGFIWHFCRQLADANKGEVVAAVLIPSNNEQYLAPARETLKAVRAAGQGVVDTDDLYPLIILAKDFNKGLQSLVDQAEIDLLLTPYHQQSHRNFDHISCAVAVVQGVETAAEETSIERILVPTAGGPNTVFSLSLLLPMTPEVKVTTLYVALDRLGPNGEALGHARLQQTLDYTDANERVESKLVSSESVAAGIAEEAGEGYDLVVLGASEESSFDQLLFGNIPAAVIAQEHIPVIILRQPKRLFGNLLERVSWNLQEIIPHKTVSERAEIYARIRRNARPSADFFIRISLAAAIAGLGLLVNSPTAIIGAMLVAPLMSPIVGLGLAVVLGDTRFLRLALGTIGRGILQALFFGFLIGVVGAARPLTEQILLHSQPNLFDLGIALFSGVAAAYALTHSPAAATLPGVAVAVTLVPPLANTGITLAAGVYAMLTGDMDTAASDLTRSLGAFLLFATNFIAIGSATAFVFLLLGFRPTPSEKARIEVQRRSTQIGLLSFGVVVLLLIGSSYFLVRQASVERRIEQIAEAELANVTGSSLVELETQRQPDGLLQLNVLTRSPRSIPPELVRELQEQIGERLNREGIADEIGLTLTVIEVTELAPLAQPTAEP